MTGVVLTHGRAPISWTSGRQPFIASSAAEAEIIGYAEAQQQRAWTNCFKFSDIVPASISTEIVNQLYHLLPVKVAHGGLAIFDSEQQNCVGFSDWVENSEMAESGTFDTCQAHTRTGLSEVREEALKSSEDDL